MKDLYPDHPLQNEADILHFFQLVIAYRMEHKSDSSIIARTAYNRTHDLKVGFQCSPAVDLLRGEMIALESPGTPDDNTLSIEAYDDMLWLRLAALVDAEIKKQTA